MTAIVEILEEHYLNAPTGVEVEQDDDSLEEIDRPWKPELIRVTTKPFSLRNILDFIDEDSLELAPDFQRLQVWKRPQKSQLIESILLQIPLPVFYFAEDSEGLLRVVDGLQRLSTIHDFVRGGEDGDGAFTLTGLEYLDDANGMRYVDLPAKWQRRLSNTQIIAHVIDPSTPAEVKYDIFRRINTGGTPLNAQEIRHCMSTSRSRTFLRQCAASPEFLEATGHILENHPRMVDREAVLRFAAFWILGGGERYREAGGAMDTLLSRATQWLDDPVRVSDEDLATIESAFRNGCRNARTVFGDHAFRKWTTYDDRRNPFNRALFESWTVTLASIDQATLHKRAAALVAKMARERMTRDYDYINAITTSTGDPGRVEYRFKVAQDILEEAGL